MDVSYKPVFFLCVLGLSPSLGTLLGISPLGQLYAICLASTYFLVKFFFSFYVLYGCNSGSHTETVGAIIKPVKLFLAVVAPICLGAAYTLENPELIALSVGEAKVAKLQNLLGVAPVSTREGHVAMGQLDNLIKAGVEVNQEHIRNQKYPLLLDYVAIGKADSQLALGNNPSEIQKILYDSTGSAPKLSSLKELRAFVLADVPKRFDPNN